MLCDMVPASRCRGDSPDRKNCCCCCCGCHGACVPQTCPAVKISIAGATDVVASVCSVQILGLRACGAELRDGGGRGAGGAGARGAWGRVRPVQTAAQYGCTS